MSKVSDNPTLQEIVTELQELRDVLDTLKAVPPVVPPEPRPDPVLPPPPAGYKHHVIPNLTHMTLRIEQSDTCVNLAGQVLPALEIVLAVGVRNVCIRGGKIKSVVSEIPGNREPCYNGLLIEDVELNNSENSTLELHGSNTTIRNVRCTAQRYCLWLGESEDVHGLLIEGCNFTSAGPESTARITDCTDVQVLNTLLQNGFKHCLRLHGRTSNVTLRGVRMYGQGNGLAAGALSGVAGDVKSLRIEDSLINVTGPDRLHLARNGSLHNVDIVGLKVVSHENWDLVEEYKNEHPADWNVSGLSEL